MAIYNNPTSIPSGFTEGDQLDFWSESVSQYSLLLSSGKYLIQAWGPNAPRAVETGVMNIPQSPYSEWGPLITDPVSLDGNLVSAGGYVEGILNLSSASTVYVCIPPYIYDQTSYSEYVGQKNESTTVSLNSSSNKIIIAGAAGGDGRIIYLNSNNYTGEIMGLYGGAGGGNSGVTRPSLTTPLTTDSPIVLTATMRNLINQTYPTLFSSANYYPGGGGTQQSAGTTTKTSMSSTLNGSGSVGGQGEWRNITFPSATRDFDFYGGIGGNGLYGGAGGGFSYANPAPNVYFYIFAPGGGGSSYFNSSYLSNTATISGDALDGTDYVQPPISGAQYALRDRGRVIITKVAPSAIYIGTTNGNKQVSSIYVGVNNVPKQVVHAYIGTSNGNKQLF